MSWFHFILDGASIVRGYDGPLHDPRIRASAQRILNDNPAFIFVTRWESDAEITPDDYSVVNGELVVVDRETLLENRRFDNRYADIIKAVALVMIDEINILRGVANLQARTVEQARAAIKNKLEGL